MTEKEAKAARDARRAKGGALYGTGKCHWCCYTVPPRALWCSADCAAEYAEETRQEAAAAAEPGAAVSPACSAL